MNNICILQISNKDDEVTSLSKQINQKYSELNRFDYKFEIFEKDVSFLEAMKQKYVHVLKYIDNYEYVCYIDSDAAFSNPNRSILELIDSSHEIFIGQDSGIVGNSIFMIYAAKIVQNYLNQIQHQYISNFNDFCNEVNKQLKFDLLSKLGTIFSNPCGLNAGFIIFKNTQIIKKFLNDVIKYVDLFESIKHDQDCVSLLLQRNEYKNLLKILPLRTQGNSALKQQPEFYYNESDSFINHIYGWPQNEKYIGLLKVKQNKWWKNILKKDEPKSFLILQTETALGDTLVTTGFFKDFKEQFPNYKIYYKVDSNNSYAINQKIDVFKNNSNVSIWNGEHVDMIIEYKCGEYYEKSDVIPCIMNSIIYEIFNKNTGLSVIQNTFNIDVYPTNEEILNILNKFDINLSKPICLVCAGVHPSINTVKYVGTKKIQTIIDSLKDKITFIQIGDTGNGYIQNRLNNVINLVDKTNVRDLFALMYYSSFVLTGIHSLLHIASMKSKFNKNVYVFYGNRECPEYYSTYLKLDHTKFKLLGYDKEKYKKCLNDRCCCLKDITNVNDYNKNLKLCCSVVKVENEYIAECMNNINENDIINDIKEILNKN